MQKTSKPAIVAWCFYDWANSAFSTLVITFIFATYFTQAVAKTEIIGTAQWGNAIALAGIIVALLSPLLGAIADHQGCRKPWLACFTLLMIVSSALLWFIKPENQYTIGMLTLVVLGTIGFEIGVVFYNAMLRGLAPKNYIGRISGWAWGLGYAGGLVCLIIALIVFVNSDTAWFHLNPKTAAQIRICGPLVAIWIMIFSLPLFSLTPDAAATGIRTSVAINRGCKTLWHTLRTLPQHKSILLFLIARMLYIDGLNTLFAFGGIYAAGTFGLSFSQVLQFGIAMNITAGLGAAAFAWIDDYFGAKKTVLISLVAMIMTGSGILLVQSQLWFWILALILGLFVGPVQAASRSFMVRLAPPEIMTEMFGLYAFSGKATAFVNPWLVGMLTLAFNSQRIGMASVIGFLIVGALLLSRVKET